MGGLQRILRYYGSMKVTGNNGDTVTHLWDYAADAPTTDEEMPKGSERWKASEKARIALLKQQQLSE